MKITIDTKEESHDSIKHIINLLSSIVDGSVQQNSIIENTPEEKPVNQGNIFADDKPEPTTEQETGSSGGIFNMFGDNSNSAPTESSSETSDEPKIEEAEMPQEETTPINPMASETSEIEEQTTDEPEESEEKVEIIEYD
jgi:hypothetical protein